MGVRTGRTRMAVDESTQGLGVRHAIRATVARARSGRRRRNCGKRLAKMALEGPCIDFRLRQVHIHGGSFSLEEG